MGETGNGIALDPEDVKILERREAVNSGVPLFVAHWHIFVPTLIIAIVYSAAWLFLAYTGKSGTGLARLFIVVMAVGVPILAAHAFLRYQTIRLQINEGHVFCHPGWPKEFPIDVPFSVIESVVVRRGFSGRLFGGGTVIINLISGDNVIVADLANPENAKKIIEDNAPTAS
ncbi:MAG: PH domain-containing protein [Pseudomonadota bacterium]